MAALLPAAAFGRVLDFHSDIRIARNGELTVTERITVEARDKTPRLERVLPRDSRVVEVVRNGHPERYVLDGERLRLGPAAVPEGRHLYQITYRAARRIAFLDGHDALHWRLTGAERVTAEVVLPAAVPARQIRVEASGGEHQSFVRDGRAAFRSQDGIAIVVRFPKGVVDDPGIARRAHWFFSDYFGALLVLGALGLSAWVLVRLKKLSSLDHGMSRTPATALSSPRHEEIELDASRTGRELRRRG